MGHSAVRRAYRYRFYPTMTQAAMLLRTFGCVRKVYNLALEARSEAWSKERRPLGYGETSALLTEWKRTDDLAYLAEVSSVPLQQALRNLHAAFVSFWAKRAGYPRYKTKRRSRRIAEYTRSGFGWRGGELRLAKMSEPLDIRWSRPLPEGVEPSTVFVSQDSSGRWFVSILVEDPTVLPLAVVDGAIGLDFGLDSLVTISTGEKVQNPRHDRNGRIRLAKAQRRLAKKVNGSANRNKARQKVAKAYATMADRRNDYLHKLSTRLVRENQTVVIEDLPIGNLLRNPRLARSIADASWRRLRSMLETKCRWYGRQLVVIERWYPSSKICSHCGKQAKYLPLDMRVWKCTSCGAEHDRDVNAARNILAAGLAVTACGADVRPQRRNPSGRAIGLEAGNPAGDCWKTLVNGVEVNL